MFEKVDVIREGKIISEIDVIRESNRTLLTYRKINDTLQDSKGHWYARVRGEKPVDNSGLYSYELF